MHALGLLLIIAFIIFIVPIIGIFQLILRFFFGKKIASRIPLANKDKTTKGVPHGTPIRKRTKRLSKTTKENI